ncbi:MAG: radical SAM protein [Candidatus Hodarchaeota archaeon]
MSGETTKGKYVPRSLKLQWHITERCNFRCSHYYQENYAGEELSFDKFLEILDQFKNLLQSWRSQTGRRIPGHVSVTGGEPFLRRDLFDLLELLSSTNRLFTFSLMTNGSFMNKEVAKKLRKLRPRSVQVSIEGTRDLHDQIRESGSYNQAVSALKCLAKEHIRTFLSFTVHRGNYHDFPDVAELGRRIGVNRVWSDRLIPCGSGADLEVLTIDETKAFFEIMYNTRKKIQRRWFSRTKVPMHRSLQFLVAGGRPHQCTAGDTLITVMLNGDLYPCRRMPIKVGNLFETPLATLYYGSELFRSLRNRTLISKGCERCFYSHFCRGGLKCLSYAVTGDPFTADPGCWLTTTNKS